jgi:hypothetical protein
VTICSTNVANFCVRLSASLGAPCSRMTEPCGPCAPGWTRGPLRGIQLKFLCFVGLHIKIDTRARHLQFVPDTRYGQGHMISEPSQQRRVRFESPSLPRRVLRLQRTGQAP